MKNSFLALVVVMCAGFIFPNQPRIAAQDDKTLLITQLTQTRDNVLKTVQGLTDEQLKYKPAPDRWSVIDCVEHITLVEKAMSDGEQQLVKQPANPALRANIKVTDDQLLNMVEDRSHKAKAPEPFVPKEGQTPQQVINNFVTQRNALIAYVTNTNDDLRNHVTDKTPLGTIDAYQMLLLDAAHTARHNKQMDEVKASTGFPK
ncbi:DinB family protein [Chitinophaga sp. Cy-1792]|uniref:DinB family protein n=1 Tax=Chitinophaga sp. Cy-1792 TaxID=2608339 RepID=UPI001422DE39|nr:DinB family protein [Chitinophaga sp. Cy-1792]NIG53492.1 DinB family protein [Chitinophaga sp. Cy-1792]